MTKKKERASKLRWRRAAVGFFFLIVATGALYGAGLRSSNARLSSDLAALEAALVSCVDGKLAMRAFYVDSLADLQILLAAKPETVTRWRTRTVTLPAPPPDTVPGPAPPADTVMISVVKLVPDSIWVPPDTVGIPTDSWLPQGPRGWLVNAFWLVAGFTVRSLLESNDREQVFIEQ